MALASRGTYSLDLSPSVGLGQVAPRFCSRPTLELPKQMKSGAINIITEAGQGVSTEMPPLERSEQGEILRSSVRLTNDHAQGTLDFAIEDGEMHGTAIQEGDVLREELVEFKNIRLDQDGQLVIDKEGTERSVQETQFIYVPRQIFITARTGCDTARSVFESISGTNVEPGQIDISSFDRAHAEAESRLEWGDDEQGEYGPVCLVAEEGRNLPEDRRIDPDGRAQFTFDHLRWEERDLYGTVTSSGYVELYRDHNDRGKIGTEEFTRFVTNEVLPHTSVAG